MHTSIIWPKCETKEEKWKMRIRFSSSCEKNCEWPKNKNKRKCLFLKFYSMKKFWTYLKKVCHISQQNTRSIFFQGFKSYVCKSTRAKDTGSKATCSGRWFQMSIVAVKGAWGDASTGDFFTPHPGIWASPGWYSQKRGKVKKSGGKAKKTQHGEKKRNKVNEFLRGSLRFRRKPHKYM